METKEENYDELNNYLKNKECELIRKYFFLLRSKYNSNIKNSNIFHLATEALFITITKSMNLELIDLENIINQIFTCTIYENEYKDNFRFLLETSEINEKNYSENDADLLYSLKISTLFLSNFLFHRNEFSGAIKNNKDQDIEEYRNLKDTYFYYLQYVFRETVNSTISQLVADNEKNDKNEDKNKCFNLPLHNVYLNLLENIDEGKREEITFNDFSVAYSIKLDNINNNNNNVDNIFIIKEGIESAMILQQNPINLFYDYAISLKDLLNGITSLNKQITTVIQNKLNQEKEKEEDNKKDNTKLDNIKSISNKKSTNPSNNINIINKESKDNISNNNSSIKDSKFNSTSKFGKNLIINTNKIVSFNLLSKDITIHSIFNEDFFKLRYIKSFPEKKKILQSVNSNIQNNKILEAIENTVFPVSSLPLNNNYHLNTLNHGDKEIDIDSNNNYTQNIFSSTNLKEILNTLQYVIDDINILIHMEGIKLFNNLLQVTTIKLSNNDKGHNTTNDNRDIDNNENKDFSIVNLISYYKLTNKIKLLLASVIDKFKDKKNNVKSLIYLLLDEVVAAKIYETKIEMLNTILQNCCFDSDASSSSKKQAKKIKIPNHSVTISLLEYSLKITSGYLEETMDNLLKFIWLLCEIMKKETNSFIKDLCTNIIISVKEPIININENDFLKIIETLPHIRKELIISSKLYKQTQENNNNAESRNDNENNNEYDADMREMNQNNIENEIEQERNNNYNNENDNNIRNNYPTVQLPINNINNENYDINIDKKIINENEDNKETNDNNNSNHTLNSPYNDEEYIEQNEYYEQNNNDVLNNIENNYIINEEHQIEDDVETKTEKVDSIQSNYRINNEISPVNNLISSYHSKLHNNDHSSFEEYSNNTLENKRIKNNNNDNDKYHAINQFENENNIKNRIKEIIKCENNVNNTEINNNTNNNTITNNANITDYKLQNEYIIQTKELETKMFNAFNYINKIEDSQLCLYLKEITEHFLKFLKKVNSENLNENLNDHFYIILRIILKIIQLFQSSSHDNLEIDDEITKKIIWIILFSKSFFNTSDLNNKNVIIEKEIEHMHKFSYVKIFQTCLVNLHHIYYNNSIKLFNSSNNESNNIAKNDNYNNEVKEYLQGFVFAHVIKFLHTFPIKLNLLNRNITKYELFKEYLDILLHKYYYKEDIDNTSNDLNSFEIKSPISLMSIFARNNSKYKNDIAEFINNNSLLNVTDKYFYNKLWSVDDNKNAGLFSKNKDIKNNNVNYNNTLEEQKKSIISDINEKINSIHSAASKKENLSSNNTKAVGEDNNNKSLNNNNKVNQTNFDSHNQDSKGNQNISEIEEQLLNKNNKLNFQNLFNKLTSALLNNDSTHITVLLDLENHFINNLNYIETNSINKSINDTNNTIIKEDFTNIIIEKRNFLIQIKDILLKNPYLIKTCNINVLLSFLEFMINLLANEIYYREVHNTLLELKEKISLIKEIQLIIEVHIIKQKENYSQIVQIIILLFKRHLPLNFNAKIEKRNLIILQCLNYLIKSIIIIKKESQNNLNSTNNKAVLFDTFVILTNLNDLFYSHSPTNLNENVPNLKDLDTVYKNLKILTDMCIEDSLNASIEFIQISRLCDNNNQRSNIKISKVFVEYVEALIRNVKNINNDKNN